jgi:hypothetical protein
VLRDRLEPHLRAAIDDRGVRQLVVDGDEAVWVAGVAAVDGGLDLRTGEHGPRRRLRRRPVDAAVLAALGFTLGIDAWTRYLPPPVLTGSAAGLLERVLVEGARVAPGAALELAHSLTGIVPGSAAVPAAAPHVEHLEAAVRIWEREPAWTVHVAGRGQNCADLWLTGGGLAAVSVVTPPGATWEIEGFAPDWSGFPLREVPRAEAAGLVASVLRERFGLRDGDPLFVQLSPASDR